MHTYVVFLNTLIDGPHTRLTNYTLLESTHKPNTQTLVEALLFVNLTKKHTFFYTPTRFNNEGGYAGITLSICPSVRLWTESCLLCIFNNSHQIHFIFAHLIKQLKGVSRVMPVSKFKNLKFWLIFEICNFDFVFFLLGIQYDSMVWVIMRQRGGILRTQAF